MTRATWLRWLTLEYRVVDFREEVVRLYNLFLEWAGRTVTGVSEETTPREVELMVVGQGVRVDERALEGDHPPLRGGRLQRA